MSSSKDCWYEVVPKINMPYIIHHQLTSSRQSPVLGSATIAALSIEEAVTHYARSKSLESGYFVFVRDVKHKLTRKYSTIYDIPSRRVVLLDMTAPPKKKKVALITRLWRKLNG